MHLKPQIYMYSIAGCVTGQSHNNKSCQSRSDNRSKIDVYFVNTHPTSEYLTHIVYSQANTVFNLTEDIRLLDTQLVFETRLLLQEIRHILLNILNGETPM